MRKKLKSAAGRIQNKEWWGAGKLMHCIKASGFGSRAASLSGS